MKKGYDGYDMDSKEIIEMKITGKIYTIRDMQVMLDSDIAELYGVETRVLNQAVKRNKERFPSEFCFQLSEEEFRNWISQFVISNSAKMGLRKLPFAFTEQGVAMLSGVLRSDMAVKMSIEIMKAFVAMRRFVSTNAKIFHRLDSLEMQQMETSKKLDYVFDAIESKNFQPKQGIFYDGQIFDAYVFVVDLVKTAKKSLVLIDNYIDESVLLIFSKRKKNIPLTILTKVISKNLELDVKKFDAQYAPITIKIFNKAHDRFLIIDDKTVYHIGASLKDLGKKWFAFSKMDISALEMLKEAGELV